MAFLPRMAALAPRRLADSVSIALLAGIVALWWANPTAIRRVQLLVFDTYQRLAPRDYQSVGVRIVDLDDTTLARLGQWPWPRVMVARLVDRLTELGATAVGFDIVFAEPDRTSPRAMADLWRRAAGPGGLGEGLEGILPTLPDHDEALARAIANAKVVTGFALTDGAGGLPPGKAGFSHAGDDPRTIVPSAYSGAIANLPSLDAAAAGVGAFNFTPSVDGVIRRVPLFFNAAGRLYPSLAAELLRVAQGARGYVVKATDANNEAAYGGRAGIAALKIGRIEVPTDAEGQLWLHFTKPAADRTVPIWRLFEPDVDLSLIEGHIVLVGTSAAGLLDLRTTPLSPAAPGVEIHAEALEQILAGAALKRPDWAEGAEITFIIVLSLALVGLLPRLGAAWCAGIGALAVTLAVGSSAAAFIRFGWLIDPLFPTLAALAVYLAASTTGYLRTESERRRVRAAFGHYLAPAMVDRLAERPERLTLGGETREMTFLFCDVRGFTTISEAYKDDPQGLTRLINRLLTPLTDAILTRRGTIDKYMGDCIMAFWNAPLDVPGHAELACEAALAMFEALDRLDEELRREAAASGVPHHPLRIGIGLNTGGCVVGNMGSRQRFDYTVLGDAVNLASRLESQSKGYGVGVVIGEATAEQTGHRFALLELDLIAVKGKTEAVRIHTILGDDAVRKSPGFARLKQAHDALLTAYRDQAWDEADRCLVEARARASGHLDGLYDLYARRIGEGRALAPGEEWDGVYRATTK
ncbi:MAG TPA: adenylate/guanylate cyclase domain-containing protein [Azospirillaceae bacterium]|nr:adenylate/guanylate cyclase domain-containing protein [Azospirillaceae bacterium]